MFKPEETEQRLAAMLPKTAEFIDCAGITRTFNIYRQPQVLTVGYILCAEEIDPPNGIGYKFSVFAEACPFDGLTRLNSKIARGLAQKYLVEKSYGAQLRHDHMAGLIRHDGLSVDGRLLSWDKLQGLLISHEGFQFKLILAEDSDKIGRV